MGSGIGGGVTKALSPAQYQSQLNKLGSELGLNVNKGISSGAASGFRNMRSGLVNINSEAQLRGAVIGRDISNAIVGPMTAGIRVVNKGVDSIGTHIKNVITGPMAQMGLAFGVLGTAAGVLTKGWNLDTTIQEPT